MVKAPEVVLFDRKLKEERQYWIEQLEGNLELADAWLDFDRPRAWSLPAESCDLALSAAFSERLTKLTGGSAFLGYAALLAGFAVALRSATGSDTLVVGSPALQDLDRPNALAIMVRLAPRQTFKELLLAVRATLLEAYERQRYPFNYLLRDLPGLAATPCPLFDAALSYGEVHGPWPPLEPCLHLRLRRAGEALAGTLEFHPEVFRRERMEAFLGQLGRQLEQALERPETPVEDLAPLSEVERVQVLAGWNATAISYPAGGMTLTALFNAQVAASPAAPAVVFEGRELSYAELDRRVNRLARHLVSLGVGPERVVGVLLERSVEMVVALLAILKAGGAYLPLEPEYPAQRLALLLASTGTGVVVSEARFAAAWPVENAPLLVDARRFSEPAEAEDAGDPAVPVLPEHLAYVIHTSGSTGQSQGAMNSHRAVVNRLLWMQQAYDLKPGERVLQKTPFSFDVSVWEFFWPLVTGGCLVVALPGGHRDTAYLSRLLAAERIAIVHFVPSMLQVFLEEDESESLPCLRLLVASGEALPWELAGRTAGRFAADLWNLYGPTEAAVDVSSRDARGPRAGRTVPIGRPIANLALYLVDRSFQPVPPGSPGELLIGGVGLARGYIGRPGLTALRFVPDPFAGEAGARLYRTGDLARHLPDGEIEFLGRLDHQVKIRGFRIELGEVEAALRRHPALADLVVVARPEPGGQLRLVAYCVPADPEADAGPGALAEELRAFLAATLPDPMIPSAFVRLDALPKLANGKVDRRALPAPESLARSRPFVAPRTPVEETLAGLWRELLRLEKVSVDDSFFVLGGHSLLLTQLASRIRKIFHVELPLRALFDLPTIADMAQAILARQVETAASSDLEGMLARLESLSPDEVAALLAAEKT